MIYTVTFNPAIDYVVHIPTLIPGKVNRSEREEIFYGGKGINISRILKTLGIESTAFGFISGFTGCALEEKLNHMGINTDFITLKSGMTRINIKIKSDCETELNASGPDIDKQALETLFAQLNSLRQGDILCLAGSVPPSLPDTIYEMILKQLSERGVNTVVDTTGTLLINTLKYKPFLIKPNHLELGELFRVKIKDTAGAELYARKLQKAGALNVLVSMAEKGALLVTEAGRCYQAQPPIGVVKNSVGAGDSMVAGFLAGFLTHKNYEYALKLGIAAGSATAFSEGLAEKEFIDFLFSKIE